MSNSNCTTPEIFLPVALIEYYWFYEVSNHGRVRSTGRHFKSEQGKILHPSIVKNGYRRIGLRDVHGKQKSVYVHKLVIYTHLGLPPSSFHEIAHNDGNPGNNNANNLRWATKKENQADRRIHGTSNDGERQTNSKLKEADVLRIHELYKTGLPQLTIAKLYNMDQTSISSILLGDTWGYLNIKTPTRKGRTVLTEQQVLYIHTARANGKTSPMLSKELGVSKSAIKGVWSGKNWPNLHPSKILPSCPQSDACNIA